MQGSRPVGPPLPLPPALGAAPVLAAFIAGVGAFLGFRSLFSVLGVPGVWVVAAAEWLGLVLLPILILTARGVRLGSLLRNPGRRGVLAGAVLAAAGLPVAELVGWLQARWIPADPAVVSALQEALVARGLPELVVLLAAAAVTPAVCEEFAFRGLLLSAASPAGVGAALGVSSLAFGAIHWVPGGGFRVLPAAALGLLAGWLAWRTASIVPALLFHLLHNGGILIAAAAGPAAGRALPAASIPGSGAPGLFSLALAVTAILFAHHLTRST